MQHLQLKTVFISFDLIYIEFQYVPGTEAQTGSIKRKIRLFFCGNADAQLKGHFDRTLVLLQLVLVVQDRYYILKSGVQQGGNAAGIRLLLKPVADDKGIFCYFLAGV